MAATLLRRTTRRATAVLAVCATLLLAAPAAAAPKDPEGGDKKLRARLETAAKGLVDAQNKLKASQKRQKQLTRAMLDAQVEAQQMEVQVKAVAGRSYRLGRFNAMTMLLSSTSPDAFLERSYRLDQMAKLDGQALTRYRTALDKHTRAKDALDGEIKEQRKQVAAMTKRKKDAEAALASVGGGAAAGGFGSGGSSAQPAPRNSDGSWPRESCSVDDPTTTGCVTPRTAHAYRQARAAGFTRYTGCFSPRSSGEHPKGRACDHSAAPGGFENVDATGGDKAYGDRLAAFYVKNADRLGVMYVIWYRQIWLPGDGWRSYSGSGSPNETHTNHVHLSVL